MYRSRVGAATVAAIALGLSLGGCPGGPPDLFPGARLEGTWKLSGAVLPADLDEFFIVFDRRGEIDEIRYRVDETIQVTISDNRFIDSDSAVDGSQVTIVANWFGVNNFVLSGTLNGDETEITGSASYRFQVGSLTIEAPIGDATLTRQ